MRALGFRVLRVRHHGDVARIELGADEMRRVLDPEIAQAAIAHAPRSLDSATCRSISRDTDSAASTKA